MMLSREVVAEGVVSELADFEALVRSLDDADLAVPSRCEGWTVGDVAAHVIGQMSDITAGRFDGLGTAEATQRQVDERRGRNGADLADELSTARAATGDLLAVFDDEAWAGPSPAGTGTLGAGVESIWSDAFLHADDIRAAVGLPSEVGPGVRASIDRVGDLLTEQGHPPVTLALDGVDEYEVSGGGSRITGDAMAFALATTGRGDPAAFGLDERANVYR